MIDAFDTASLGKMAIGAAGGLMGDNRAQKAREKAEAIQKANTANSENLEAKVRGVSEEFVSVFMNQVMKSMRATVPETKEMHGDNGEKFFQEMLDTEYSSYMAKGSGYGLTDLVYESMMTNYRMQANQTEPQAPAVPAVADEKELTVDAVE